MTNIYQVPDDILLQIAQYISFEPYGTSETGGDLLALLYYLKHFYLITAL